MKYWAKPVKHPDGYWVVEWNGKAVSTHLPYRHRAQVRANEINAENLVLAAIILLVFFGSIYGFIKWLMA